MLTFINLENFKSFKKIKFDLRGKQNKPKKIAFIYGENGAGKSNLMESFFFLHSTFDTLKLQEKLKKISADDKFNDILSKINNEIAKTEFFEEFLKKQFSTIEDIISEYKMIDSKENLKLEFGFYLEEKEGIYSIEFDDSKIISETLKFTINERVGEIFSIDSNNIKLNDSIFLDSIYKKELKEDIEQYWGKHSFMSLLYFEINNKNKNYVNSKINKNLLIVLEWFKNSTVLCKGSHMEKAYVSVPYGFLSDLENGIIKEKKYHELHCFEKLLNAFFTQLYSDIKKVYYKLVSDANGTEHYELYVQKLIYNKLIEIPFKKESTGTQNLLNLFPYFFSSLRGSTVLIDEVDTGIHDLLMHDIIEIYNQALIETNNGQFIATTHNTTLMNLLPKESIYIVVSDARGNKEVVNIDDYKFRTQKSNSIQNKYFNGDYKGIPYVGNLDFTELIFDLENSLVENNQGKKIEKN